MELSDIETIVAETLNHLEHEYGFTDLDGIGSPTVQEIAKSIHDKHWAPVEPG